MGEQIQCWTDQSDFLSDREKGLQAAPTTPARKAAGQAPALPNKHTEKEGVPEERKREVCAWGQLREPETGSRSAKRQVSQGRKAREGQESSRREESWYWRREGKSSQ